MTAIILFAFAILYIIAWIEDIRRQSHDAAVRRQWDKREKERDAFIEMYGANDDEVAEALKEDAFRKPLAETIRERLKKEANVDHTAKLIGYSLENIDKLRKIYSTIRFPVGDHQELFCKMIYDGVHSNDAIVCINPNILYSGSNPRRIEISKLYFSK